MVDPTKVQHNVTLFTMPPNATEVLQRLRVRVEKGYLGLAFRRSLSWDINTPAFLRPLAIRP